MSDKSAFDKRENQFEAEYFNRKDAEQIAKLKAVFQAKADKEGISKATGVTDEKLLDRMLGLQLSGELMSAFQLYPLIEVAWADGTLDDGEAAAVLAAAEKRGIAKDSKAHAFLSERLSAGPSKDLHSIWLMYAGQLKTSLSAADLDAFRADVFELCRSVAQSSGGLLGKAFSVSSAEKNVLADVEKALTR